MRSRASVCVLLALVILSAAHRHNRSHPDDLRENYEHMMHILEYPCHAPQPRLVPVEDLIGSPSGLAFFPDATVLHRCDRTGYCSGSSNTCMSVTEQPVELPFKVTFTEDREENKKGDWSIEYYSVANHTECACSR